MTLLPEALARVRDFRPGVLAVDDDHGLLRTLRDALRPQYRFWSSPSAERGRKILERVRRIHGVLVDLRLPGMSGLDFARHLRSAMPHLKVILMTGFDPHLAVQEAAKVGASGFLPKPFSLEALRLMLASRLGG